MPRNVLLNNIDHKDLRVIGARSAEYGDEVMYTLTFPAEFRSVQAHYPIVFGKSADGQFQPLALFGFKQGQNLFLDRDGWQATYVPLMIERHPFLIGGGNGELLVHIDLDHPRVSRTQGEALFREHGGNTEYLERISSMLLAIHQGLAGTAPFIAALLEHDLLESFVFDIQLADGSQNRLSGFYTIHEERLRNLDSAALAKLNAPGYLQAIFMVIASMSNFRSLIERQQTRLKAGNA
jgi:SapC